LAGLVPATHVLRFPTDVDARDTSASTRVFDALLPAHDVEFAASVMAGLRPGHPRLAFFPQTWMRDGCETPRPGTRLAIPH